MRRTNRIMDDPLRTLVEGYERYGPIFTLRIFHHNVVFMLGPAANHHVLVSGAANMSWREGELRSLVPFLGDGLLTTDGAYHRTHRQDDAPRVPPRAHRRRDRRHRGRGRAAPSRRSSPAPSSTCTTGSRHVALRVAMRALFGLDPDRARAGGLRRRGRVRGGALLPRAQRRRAGGARPRLAVRAGAARAPPPRRAARRGRSTPGAPATGSARTSCRCSCEARDEDGDPLPRDQIRDEVMTLLFAGHDTTSSTMAFLFYELARNPELHDGPGHHDGDAHRRDAAQVPAGVHRPAAVDRAVRVPGRARSPAARTSTTARGRATTCPTCGPTRTGSTPTASPPSARRSSRRAPTCRSAAARARASACGSARREIAIITRAVLEPLPARARARATGSRSARRRRSRRRTACR